MEIMVSILTTAYNHAPYIAQTLDSFLMQKTNFQFEVIIHDDASSDGTADIILEYAKKYPDIIRPIFQTENQYSKGVDVYSFMNPLVRGKYIAVCEGDDFWCDECKLQKQFDFMEAHPDYSACVHNTKYIHEETGIENIMYDKERDYDIEFSQVIERGGAAYQTSALFYRKEIDEMLQKEKPPYFDIVDFGDFPYSIYLCCKGKIHFIANIMSVYRAFTPYSWSANHRYDTAREQEEQRLNQIRVLESVDSYTKGRYRDEIMAAIDNDYFCILIEYLRHFEGGLLLHCHYFIKLTWKSKLDYLRRIYWKLKTCFLGNF